MRARLAMQDALDDDRIAKQNKNGGNEGGSNDRSPPSRAIIRYPEQTSLFVNAAHRVIQWHSPSSFELNHIKTHAPRRHGASVPPTAFRRHQCEGLS